MYFIVDVNEDKIIEDIMTIREVDRWTAIGMMRAIQAIIEEGSYIKYDIQALTIDLRVYKPVELYQEYVEHIQLHLNILDIPVDESEIDYDHRNTIEYLDMVLEHYTVIIEDDEYIVVVMG